jgi:hypothetical protein
MQKMWKPEAVNKSNTGWFFNFDTY